MWACLVLFSIVVKDMDDEVHNVLTQLLSNTKVGKTAAKLGVIARTPPNDLEKLE